MSEALPLFEVNSGLDRAALASCTSRSDQRLQIRDVLTPETAREIRSILARDTEWGISVAGRHRWPASLTPNRDGRRWGSPKSRRCGRQAGRGDAGRDARLPLRPLIRSSTAYLEQWDPGGPHDLLLEHINADPFLDLVREITGFPICARPTPRRRSIGRAISSRSITTAMSAKAGGRLCARPDARGMAARLGRVSAVSTTTTAT